MMTRRDQRKLVERMEKKERQIKQRVISLVTSPKAIMIAIGIGFTMALTLALFAFYTVSRWYDVHQVIFQSPSIHVRIDWPIVVRERGAIASDEAELISPIPLHAEIQQVIATSEEPSEITAINNYVNYAHLKLVRASKYPELFNHIWIRESSQGTNQNPNTVHMKCRDKGMSNEIGYFPKGGYCFTTFADSIARFERWRENEAKGLTDNQALCYYNTGRKIDVCPYLSTDFLSMN